MKRAWLAFGLLAAAVLAFGAFRLLLRASPAGMQPTEAVQRAVLYHCPMHPAMTSKQPADCPICGMRMVPVEEDRALAPGVAGEAPDPSAGVPPSGLATVQLSLRKQQLIGIKTSPVAIFPFRRTVRAVGRVAYDETRQRHVTTKTGGYVEKLYANAVGMYFEKGQPLLEIFSPELLASQQEYLLALRTRARTIGSTIPSIAGTGDELVDSARRRLELFDVSEREIRDLESSGTSRRTVTLRAPAAGYLTHRGVTHGDRVEAGAHLMDITDLTHVWIVASVYEYELPFVRVGQAATITLAYLPGKTIEGRVSLVYPVLEATTRTVQVRVELSNPEMLLKPDMFAEVHLEADLGARLGVPDTAVLDTGTRRVVFVDRGEGQFEPREVAIGLRTPDMFEVLSGVVAGDRVVTSGNFFVDSEAKLKAALAASAAENPPPQLHEH